jgi:hypothetical protein
MIKVTSIIKVENEEVMNRMFAMLVENFGVKIQFTVEEEKAKLQPTSKGN